MRTFEDGAGDFDNHNRRDGGGQDLGGPIKRTCVACGDEYVRDPNGSYDFCRSCQEEIAERELARMQAMDEAQAVADAQAAEAERVEVIETDDPIANGWLGKDGMP